MSVQSQIRRVRYAAAPTDLTTDAIAGFVYPRPLSCDVVAGVKTYPRSFLASDHDHFPSVRGEKEASIKMELELLGFGTGAGAAVEAGDGENGLLLKSVWGKQTLDTGVAAIAGCSPTALKAASTDLLTVGGFVGLVDPTTGAFHVRQIRANAAGTLTLDRALPFTPAAAAVIYASAWYSHGTQGFQHLWFDVEGFDANTANNWRRYVRGCLGDVELTLAGVGKLTFDLKGMDWLNKDGTTQGAAVYPTGLPSAGMFPGRSTRVWLGSASTPCTAFAFKLGNDVQPKPCIATPSGISGFFIKDAARTFEFTALHDDGGSAFIANLTAGTFADLLVEVVGNGPGNSCALAAPVVEINDVKLVSVNGLDAYTVSGAVLRGDSVPAKAGLPDVSFGML